MRTFSNCGWIKYKQNIKTNSTFLLEGRRDRMLASNISWIGMLAIMLQLLENSVPYVFTHTNALYSSSSFWLFFTYHCGSGPCQTATTHQCFVELPFQTSWYSFIIARHARHSTFHRQNARSCNWGAFRNFVSGVSAYLMVLYCHLLSLSI